MGESSHPLSYGQYNIVDTIYALNWVIYVLMSCMSPTVFICVESYIALYIVYIVFCTMGIVYCFVQKKSELVRVVSPQSGGETSPGIL